MLGFLKHRPKIKNWLCVFAGIILSALSLDLFLVGNNIVAGGISGIAIVLTNFLQLNVATMIFIMNVPILIAALVINGWRYTIGAMISSFLFSFAVQLLSILPTITYNPLVAAVFGGAIYGAGMALLAVGNGSVGGTDLVNRLLVKKFPGISLGKMAIFVDGSIVIFP